MNREFLLQALDTTWESVASLQVQTNFNFGPTCEWLS